MAARRRRGGRGGGGGRAQPPRGGPNLANLPQTPGVDGAGTYQHTATNSKPPGRGGIPTIVIAPNGAALCVTCCVLSLAPVRMLRMYMDHAFGYGCARVAAAVHSLTPLRGAVIMARVGFLNEGTAARNRLTVG
jgi:hypothetical protein